MLLMSLLTLLAVGFWLDEHRVGFGIWELLSTPVMPHSITSVSTNRGQA